MVLNFDHDSSFTRMLTDLQTKESVSNIVLTSTSVPLLSIFAEEISNLANAELYYTRETKWDKAQNIASLIYQGRFRGYTPLRKQGATGNLKVSTSATYNSAYGLDIIIYKYTKFLSVSGLTFCASDLVTLTGTSNYVEVPVVQGIPKSYTYVALGNNLEKVQVANTAIEETYFDVYVNDVIWTNVTDIEEYGATDKVYELHNYGDFEGIELIFGNDIYGKKLQANDVVVFKYVETSGEDGNVENTDNVTVVSSVLYDSDGVIVPCYCTNESYITGGKNQDEIEYIRSKGLQSFMGGDKAVTMEGYEYQLSQSQYIDKCVVWGAYEYNIDQENDPWDFIPSEDNVIHIAAYSPTQEQLTDEAKEAIILDLVTRKIKPPCDIIQFTDVEFIGLEFHVDAYVSDRTVNLSVLKTSIQDGLALEYDSDNLSFKQPIYDTQWKAYISSLTGVYYHTSYLNLVAYPAFTSNYVAPIALLDTAITAGTILFYAKKNTVNAYTLIATCTGTNTWVAESGYTATGTMDLTNGVGSITVTGTIFDAGFATYDLKVVYTPTSLDFEPADRYQIFKIDSVTDVSTAYTL